MYIFKTLEYLNLSVMTESGSVVAWGIELQKGYGETLRALDMLTILIVAVIFSVYL